MTESSASLPTIYVAALQPVSGLTVPEIVGHLRTELPYLWRNEYVAATPKATNVLRVTFATFEYIFDNYQILEQQGVVTVDPTAESRLVAVHGVSQPRKDKREDGRLGGWVGPTEKTFGREWDKGHFIGHSLGG